MADDYSLAPGARFFVMFRCSQSECQSFEGVYRGLSAIGPETALVFEMEEGLRFVNASSVVTMDQVEAAPEEASGKKKQVAAADSVFYG